MLKSKEQKTSTKDRGQMPGGGLSDKRPPFNEFQSVKGRNKWNFSAWA